MIVDNITLTDAGDGRATRTARVRTAAGLPEAQIVFSGPAALAAPPHDATSMLAALLPLAMRMKERELAIDGEVCPRVRIGADELQAIYSRWSPAMHPVALRTSGATTEPTPQASGVACFFSRGVDSTYSAAAPRDPPITHLVFVDRLDLRHDETVRAEEIRRARLVAERVELPLVEAYTNIRVLTEPWMDWEDACGAGLAACAHHLASGFARAIVPSGASYDALTRAGTHPLIEPLYSGRQVEIVHDSCALARVEKVRWIAEHRRDLLDELKVCLGENRPDNCGRCPKCIVTMIALRAAGALEQASQFPDVLRTEDVESLRLNAAGMTLRIGLAHSARHLDPSKGTDRPLLDAIMRVLADPGSRVELEPHEGPTITMGTYHARTLVAHLRDGRPYPPVAGGAAPRASLPSWDGAICLVRALDHVGGRHTYGIGSRPGGAVVGELGALRSTPPPDGGRAVWLCDNGLVAIDGRQSPAPRASVYLRARWVVAPLAWRRLPVSLRERLALVGWRARRLLAPAVRAAAAAHGIPVGWLHATEADGLVALYEARHPITGDQLLTDSEHEAADLGYLPCTLVGYLDPPLGRADRARLDIPWGSRWGRHARLRPPSAASRT